jgi:hypothetical protein
LADVRYGFKNGLHGNVRLWREADIRLDGEVGRRVAFAELSVAALKARMREQVIVPFRRRVTGEACFVQRLVVGFAVCELGKPPAGGRGVFFESMTMNLIFVGLR